MTHSSNPSFQDNIHREIDFYILYLCSSYLKKIKGTSSNEKKKKKVNFLILLQLGQGCNALCSAFLWRIWTQFIPFKKNINFIYTLKRNNYLHECVTIYSIYICVLSTV